MCKYRRFITNPYTGRILTVTCGHCPACKQSKAIARTNRIRNNIDSTRKSHLVLFCTFTYRNDSVPYIRIKDYNDSDTLNIYRDSDNRVVRKKGNHYGFRAVPHTTCLDSIELDYKPADIKFKPLRDSRHGIYDSDKVGVLYNKDFQDFVKRLRINLQRKFNYELPLNYFYCSEYGPTTQRPHFHALFFVPLGCYSLFKRAIASSWPFDDYKQCFRNIQIAKNAASYVSSYVNSSASVPSLFQNFRQTKMAHHYSQGFGIGQECFSLSEVYKAFTRRDLRISVPRYKGQSLINDLVLLPKYVVNRYFPKFKGYRYLTTDEIELVYERPSEIERFKYKCRLDDVDIWRIFVMLSHKQDYAVASGLNAVDFAMCASQIWTIYSSNVMREFYESIDHPLTTLLAYDNITDVYLTNQPFLADYLDVLSDYYPKGDMPLYELNNNPLIIAKANRLEDLYNSYTKRSKVRNLAYAQIFNV